MSVCGVFVYLPVCFVGMYVCVCVSVCLRVRARECVYMRT